MIIRSTRFAPLLAGLAALVVLAGCSSYVKKDDFNAAISQLQQKDQQLQQQIDSLKADLTQRFAQYDARLTAMEGRITVDNVAYFAFAESDLQDQYKPMLDDFAEVMNSHHAKALVTVEGFTDPAGSRGYNQKLGQQRAEAVREYLVNTAGMPADQVRAVSYGENSDRQIAKGETRGEGKHNRRAVLVIDFAG